MVQEFFTGQFVPPAGALIIVTAATAICALTLFGWVDVAGSAALAWAALTFFVMSLLPALASGVMPLRLVEPAFLLYAGGSLLGMLFLPRLMLIAIGRLWRKRPMPI